MEAQEFEFAPVLKVTLKVLGVAGFNPLDRSRFARARAILSLISIAFIFFTNIPPVIFEWDGISTLQNVEFLPALFMIYSKCVNFFVHQNDIAIMLTTLKELWPISKFGEEKQKEMEKTFNFAYKLCKLYLGFLVQNIVFIVLWPAIHGHFFFPPLQLCDAFVSPCFILQMSWHIFADLFQINPVFIGADLLFLCFVTYIYTAIEMLKASFEEMQLVAEDASNYKQCQENLWEIVNQHNVIITAIKRLNKIYSSILLVHFWSSLGTLIFTLYMQTADGIPPDADHISKYGVLFGTFLFGLAIYSTGGDIIYDQSLSVSDAAYNVPWYAANQIKLRRDLAFIIQRAQKVERLLVGNMSDLNLVLFASTVQNALSAYMLLLTLENSGRKLDF